MKDWKYLLNGIWKNIHYKVHDDDAQMSQKSERKETRFPKRETKIRKNRKDDGDIIHTDVDS